MPKADKKSNGLIFWRVFLTYFFSPPSFMFNVFIFNVMFNVFISLYVCIRWVKTFCPNFWLLIKRVIMCLHQQKWSGIMINIFWMISEFFMTLRITLCINTKYTRTWNYVANANIINRETQNVHVQQYLDQRHFISNWSLSLCLTIFDDLNTVLRV